MRNPSRVLVLSLLLGIGAGQAFAQARDCAPNPAPLPGPNERVAVAFVIDPQPSNIVEGRSLAPHCRITPTLQSFLTELVALKNQPIATIHIVSHSVVGQGHLRNEGVVMFPQGTQRAVNLSKLAQEVKQVLPGGLNVNQISFRGCRIGAASQASLDAFRQSLGAVAAWGATCRTVIMSAGPMLINNRDIRSRSHLRNAQEQAFFDTEFPLFLDQAFVDSTGRSVSNCIVGLNANHTAAGQVDMLEDLYFANDGELAAVWTNNCQTSGAHCLPFTPPASKCFIRLKRDSGTCRTVRVGD